MPPCVSTDVTCDVSIIVDTIYSIIAVHMLSPESQREDNSGFSKKDLLIFIRGFSILSYKWNMHTHKMTLTNGLLSRNQFSTGLLLFTVS